MFTLTLLVFTVFLRNVMAANETEAEYTYKVAVVEYKPIRNELLADEADHVNPNALEYITLLNSTHQDLELIVFPEATLLEGGTSEATEVPVPFTDVICNSSDTRTQDHLKRFSCAAIDYNTTIVVNILEKENCTTNNATGFCPSSGIIYYNSDVAFNNTGGVIGRYRKWNLFGEYNKSPPANVELVSITTKNNNTFGIFTCFDLMFYQPALNLTRDLGLKNILFPTMWFSELPFLTALQVQQMWAQENDVNFMSAGANSPQVGSGGSGIFVGKYGPLDLEIIGGSGGTRVLIQNVPKPEIEINPYRNFAPVEEDTDSLAPAMDTFKLITDPSIANYRSVVLDTNKTAIVEQVCDGDSIRICCDFSVALTVNQSVATVTGNKYTYHLVAFNGIRSFSGVRDGGFESCGVLACLNDSVASCGHRFSNYSEIVWPLTFESIVISANFSDNENRIQFPNSVLASLRPVSPQYTTWTREVSNGVVTRNLSLITPQNRLLTFGIFGRDFSRDGALNKPEGNKSVQMKEFGYAFVVSLALLLVTYNRCM